VDSEEEQRNKLKREIKLQLGIITVHSGMSSCSFSLIRRHVLISCFTNTSVAYFDWIRYTTVHFSTGAVLSRSCYDMSITRISDFRLMAPLEGLFPLASHVGSQMKPRRNTSAFTMSLTCFVTVRKCCP
jgi:hypothetical protein